MKTIKIIIISLLFGVALHAISPLNNEFKKPIGLQNWGQTCYMNAALQCVIAIPQLTDVILSSKTNTTSMTGKYKNLIENLLKIEKNGTYKPDEFVTCQPLAAFFGINIDQLESQQQDANEFVGYLLDRLSEDDPEIKKKIKNIFNFDVTNILEAPLCITPVNRKINGSMTSLELAINPGQDTLSSCLEDFFQKEEIGGYRCPDGDTTNATKQVLLTSVPEVLRISLKRFNALGEKISDKVTVPFHGLNLAKYGGQKDVNYDLLGFVMHSGETINSGHYTACVKYGTQWHYCDDSTVMPISEDKAKEYSAGGSVNHTPYVLFYAKYDKKSADKAAADKAAKDKLAKDKAAKIESEKAKKAKALLALQAKQFKAAYDTLAKQANVIWQFKVAQQKKDTKKVKQLTPQINKIKVALNKANINTRNNLGQTPLMVNPRIAPIVYVLDTKKAQNTVNAKDKKGKTVLQYLIQSKYVSDINLYRALRSAGVKVTNNDIKAVQNKLKNQPKVRNEIVRILKKK